MICCKGTQSLCMLPLPIASPHSQHEGDVLLFRYYTEVISALHNPCAFCGSGACTQAQPLNPPIPHLSETSKARWHHAWRLLVPRSSLLNFYGRAAHPKQAKVALQPGLVELEQGMKQSRVYVDVGRW